MKDLPDPLWQGDGRLWKLFSSAQAMAVIAGLQATDWPPLWHVPSPVLSLPPWLMRTRTRERTSSKATLKQQTIIEAAQRLSHRLSLTAKPLLFHRNQIDSQKFGFAPSYQSPNWFCVISNNTPPGHSAGFIDREIWCFTGVA